MSWGHRAERQGTGGHEDLRKPSLQHMLPFLTLEGKLKGTPRGELAEVHTVS